MELTEAEKVEKVVNEYDLSESQVKEYKDTFDRLDLSGDGRLDIAEFRSAMYFWGHNLTDGEVSTLYRKYDIDKSGTITFSEYLVLFIEKIRKTKKEAKYAALFQSLDTNRDGFLSEDELKIGLVNEFEDIIDCEQDDLEQLMREVTVNKEGKLSYIDFIKALRYKGFMD